MKGDFSRDTFDAANHFSRVLMQQGRVQLDADWNEQASILLHYLQTLAADLIGPHGGPATGSGFTITPDGKEFKIGKGRYYVDGVLCENEAECAYSAQPDYPLTAEAKKVLAFDKGSWLIYLDVWERHITYLEDEHIREVALGGPDTATRAQVVWQVKALEVQAGAGLSPEDRRKLAMMLAELQARHDQLLADLKLAEEKNDVDQQEKIKAQLQEVDRQMKEVQERLAAAPGVSCDTVDDWPATGKCRLRARVKPEDVRPDPCITAPDSKYRGAENQLYRVEIHDVTHDSAGVLKQFTFKWSRDNGSIVTNIVENKGAELVVRRARGFDAGQWVELSTDDQDLRGEHGTLVKVVKVEGDVLTIEPTKAGDTSHATKVRRWDQTQVGDVELVDGAVKGDVGKPLDLEDGIQVEFEKSSDSDYRTGDYWLIPARVATGSIEWPWQTNPQGKVEVDARKRPVPAWLPPHGIQHHYAPLATLQAGTLSNCRCTFDPARICPP